jgi:hypothetical protein
MAMPAVKSNAARARPSNVERLLKWAQLGHPIRQRDWMNIPTPDGGVPILRVAVGVQRLERRGHRFDRRKFGGHSEVEYILLREHVETSTSCTATAMPTEQDALFAARSSAPFWERDL